MGRAAVPSAQNITTKTGMTNRAEGGAGMIHRQPFGFFNLIHHVSTSLHRAAVNMAEFYVVETY